MYQSEADYKKAQSAELRALGFSIQPIESPGTGLGIPDWYLSSKYRNIRAWVEFKNFEIGHSKRVAIPYRLGQLAWLTEYSRNGTFCILACSTEYGERYFYNTEIKKDYDRGEFIRWPRLRIFQE